MIVKTHWPALVPAILKAGHEPCLVEPLEFGEGKVKMMKTEDGRLIITHPSCPAVILDPGFHGECGCYKVIP